jgi:hypothetical protein
MRWMLLSLCGLALIAGRAAAQELPVVHADDFEGGMDHWAPLAKADAPPLPADQSPFAVVEVEGPEGKPSKVLRAIGNSKYEPPFRSPPNVALLKDVIVGDFEITAKVQSTNPGAGPHRDMCVVWGYQDPSHFYYVHFGAVNTPDTNSCQIFIVNDAARTPVTVKQVEGTPWNDGWIDVKVTRNVETGETNVYFINMDEPIMTAKDTKFAWGQVGLGTFDDNGNWDNFVLKGKKVERPAGE